MSEKDQGGDAAEHPTQPVTQPLQPGQQLQPPPQVPQPPGVPAPPPSYGPGGTASYGTATTNSPPAPVGRGMQMPARQPEPWLGNRGAMVVVAVLAGLLLLGAGFGLGRLSAPSGPASLIDAVRMAQQGTLPCGSTATGNGAAGLLSRLCQNGPGQIGPGQGFGPRANSNGTDGLPSSAPST